MHQLSLHQATYYRFWAKRLRWVQLENVMAHNTPSGAGWRRRVDFQWVRVFKSCLLGLSRRISPASLLRQVVEKPSHGCVRWRLLHQNQTHPLPKKSWLIDHEMIKSGEMLTGLIGTKIRHTLFKKIFSIDKMLTWSIGYADLSRLIDVEWSKVQIGARWSW